MSGKVVLQEENNAADYMSRIAETMKLDNQRIWETKVPRGLRQILIEDVVVTKVHFKPSSTKIPVDLVKFELLSKERDEKAIGSKEQFKKKKIVSKWFEVLIEYERKHGKGNCNSVAEEHRFGTLRLGLKNPMGRPAHS
ncbi:hypothetical protein FH972_009422 [Carpinus fangiana]|uniref:Uncharacterized protein n=1 Tax=Carpinus fangiana TaxID=176857 RepID=A0A5N6R4T1_9ROSI|nr:hypothetical protein FH972_009422 [Carpinus fangiana]